MKKAFTMAEVLITLGILGVVIAFTLPILMEGYRKQVVETRLARFYSVINQAVLRSEVDNGSKEYWDKSFAGWQLDENGLEDRTKPSYPALWYDKYLKKYLKTLEVKQEQSESGKIILYFEDGSCVLISSASIIFYPDAKYYEAVVEEENGMHRDKNLAGTKFFDFEWNPKKGIEPYTSGWDGTRNNLLNSNSLGCKKEVTNERAYCTKLIQMNGWKIPKDYPLRF